MWPAPTSKCVAGRQANVDDEVAPPLAMRVFLLVDGIAVDDAAVGLRCSRSAAVPDLDGFQGAMPGQMTCDRRN